eukprot:tig00001657_g9543.t1
MHAHKPRWRTPEFVGYISLIAGAIVVLTYWGVQNCDPYNRNVAVVEYEFLAAGWIPGHRIDLSDNQYAMWRKNFWILAAAMAGHLLLAAAVRRLRVAPEASPYEDGSGAALGGALREEEVPGVGPRLAFSLLFSLGFVAYVHRFSALWLLGVVLVNFGIGRACGASRWNLVLTWAWCIFVRFSSELNGGYRLSDFFNAFHSLDGSTGMLRWWISFNLCMLRLVSFNTDYYWALRARPSPVDVRSKSEYTRRQETSLPARCYSLPACLAYALYVPLYIAGPITSFNAFYSHMLWPQRAVPLRRALLLLARALLVFLGIDVSLHFLYYYGVVEYGLWRELPAWELGLTGYFTITFMWCKFLVIWRFFRAWALLDGVEVPENMLRCVSNNCSFTGFWRSWHASFNKWVLRYMYIPLGGRRTQAASIWLIFSFIGAWHDLRWQWCAWALLNCAFFSLEIVVLTACAGPAMEGVRRRPAWRHVRAAGGALGVVLLMVANLAILLGFEGAAEFFRLIFLSGPPAHLVFAAALLIFFAAAQIQFEIREAEGASGAGGKES